MLVTIKGATSLPCLLSASLLLVCSACASSDAASEPISADAGAQSGPNDDDDSGGGSPSEPEPGEPGGGGNAGMPSPVDGPEPDSSVDPPGPGAGGQPQNPPETPADPSGGGVQAMRRLSHVEYANTLRDLFPETDFNLPTLPDERLIDGFSNAAEAQEPSDLLTEQYFTGAVNLARALSPQQIDELAPCGQTLECAEQFVTDFGQRAFRRPLTETEIETFTDAFVSGPGAEDFELGVRLVVMGMLQSGSFLYRPELGEGLGDDGNPLTQYEIASRLSYLLWASTPDASLLAAAENGALATSEGVQEEVERLLADPKARDGLVNFFSEWLVLPKVQTTLRNRVDSDEALGQELVESAVRFVYDQVFAGGGTSDDLLTSNVYPATTGVAELLGIETQLDGWETVTADPAQRAGFLTHPAFLAAYGYSAYASPVLRGVYIMDHLLCSPPSPPPMDVEFNLPPPPDEASEPQTNREAYEQVTSTGDGCVSCHTLINPLGFAFENYDTMGRYRTEDNGFEVNASGSSFGMDFQNGIELVQQIAESDRYRACVVSKLVSYGTGGGAVATDAQLKAELLTTFAEGSYSLKELLVALATHEKISYWLEAPTQSN